MADNVAITAGSGTTVAADEVTDGTLGSVKVQYVKLMDGTLDGTTKAAVGANGLAVSATASGAAAHDAVVSGNPVLVAGEARDGNGTAVSSGDVVRLNLDRYGRTQYRKPKLSHASSDATPITTATDTIVVAAPSAGNHLLVWRILAVNSGATATWVYWRDGVAGTRRYPMYLAQNGSMVIEVEGTWELTTATALYVTTTGTGNVEWHVDYETVTD